MSDWVPYAIGLGTSLFKGGTPGPLKLAQQQMNFVDTLIPQELQNAYQQSLFGTSLFNQYQTQVLPALLGYYGQLAGLPSSLSGLFQGTGSLSMPNLPYLPPETLHAQKPNSPQDRQNLLTQINNLNQQINAFMQNHPDAAVPGTPNYQTLQAMQQQLWSYAAAYGIDKLQKQEPNVATGFYANVSPASSASPTRARAETSLNLGAAVAPPSGAAQVQGTPNLSAPGGSPFELTPWEQQELNTQMDFLAKSQQSALSDYRAQAAKMGISDSTALAAGEAMIQQATAMQQAQLLANYQQQALARRMQALGVLLNQAAAQSQLGLGLAESLQGAYGDVVNQALGVGSQMGQMGEFLSEQQAQQQEGLGALLGGLLGSLAPQPPSSRPTPSPSMPTPSPWLATAQGVSLPPASLPPYPTVGAPPALPDLTMPYSDLLPAIMEGS
jgi:hypothetical protein